MIEVRHSERAGEHVGRPTGERCQRRVGADEPVGRLVERAVARRDDHHVDAVAGGGPGETSRVAAAVRLRDLEAVVLAEELLHPHASARRHGRRGRVDDQEQTHGRAG